MTSSLSLLLGSILLAGPTLPTPNGPVLPQPKPNGPTVPIKPIPRPAKSATTAQAEIQPICGKFKFRIPDQQVSKLMVSGGKNQDMGGYWRRLWVQTNLRATKRDIVLSGWVKANQEYRNGTPKYRQAPTSYARFFDRRIPVPVNPGCEIKSISLKDGSARGRYRDGHSYVKAYGKGAIDYADCRTDTNGNDENKLGCRKIRFREIEVETQRAFASCRTITLYHTTVSVDRMQHTRGDTDLWGNDPYVKLDSRVDVTHGRSRVSLRTDVEFEESRPDHTTFKKTNRLLLFRADRDAPGCEVERVEGTSGRLRAQSHPDRRGRPQGFGAPGALHSKEGIISHAGCWPDAPGNDRDRVGCSSVSHSKIVIHLRRKR